MIDEHLKFRNWRWWTVALRGVAAIVFGILALASPKAAFLSLVILFGIYAIADGLLALSLGRRSGISRGAMYGHGIVSIVAGVIALALPQAAGLFALVLIASWAILAGIFEIVTAVRIRHVIEHEWLLGIEGALSVAFGVMLLVSPLAGAIVLGLWVGIYALVLGGMLVGTGLRLRSAEHTHHLPSAAAA